MRELPKIYEPQQTEERIYRMWQDGGYFHAEADESKKPFTIVMPPPNVTGQLHMGHAMDATLQDTLIRVVNMGGYSVELCGGTHLDNTAKVGPFELESECSVASGVRRIEAITGKACLERMEKSQKMLFEAAARLKTKPAELTSRIQTYMDEVKDLKRAIEQYKSKEAAGDVDRFLFGSRNVRGFKVLTAMVPKADANRLRQMGDLLREKEPGVVAVLASVKDDKPAFLAVCGKDAVAAGLKAGELVKQVCCCCGGSGGGKPDSAMGGGKDVTKVDNALALVDDYVDSKIQ